MIRNNVVGVILFLSILLTVAIRWVGLSGENYRNIINSDGLGYYHYYVSAFDEHGFEGQQANGTYLVNTSGGKVVNKYFVGLPVLWSPFVLPVYAYYSLSADMDVNLYAQGFQIAISIAALFYLFLGLLALKKLLLSFKIEPRVVNFTLFAFFFGTNLSYYIIIAPSMSHVYSFALISGFLYFIRQYSLKNAPQHLIYSGLILAFIILVRPVNILILVAVPIVWKKGRPFLALLKSHIEVIVSSLFLVVMVVALQPLFWYFQTGSLIQWSYAGEGFYFLHPAFYDFIFSFRKGFLIYTPILFFSIISISVIYRSNKFRAIYSLAFYALLIYVLSSWWNWYYGDSFGSRVMIDYYAIFILFFAYLLQNTRHIMRMVLLTISIMLIILNVFQSYQYHHNIMSQFDMNFEKYSYIFGKYGEEYENRLGGNSDIAPYHTEPMEKVFSINSRMPSSFYHISCAESINGNNQTQVLHTKVDGQQFPCTISIKADELIKYKTLYVKMICSSYNEGPELNDVYWMTTLQRAGERANYYAFRINDTPIRKDGLRIDTYHFSIPIPKSMNDEVLISLWNKGRKSFIITSMQLEVYGIIE